MCTRCLTLVLSLLLGLLGISGAEAVVLDWSAVAWTAGSLSNSFDVDGDSVNDINITISGDTSALVSGYPTIGTALQGGLGSVDEALEFRVNFANASQSITVTVTFLNDYQDATDVSFSLFDIDANRVGASSNYRFRDYVDEIAASGDAGLIAATITPSSANSVAGSGTNQTITANATAPDTGASSGDGTVDVNFGTNHINSYSFTFGNTGSILSGNPQEQSFAIHDVTFKKTIPEVGTMVMAVVICTGTVGLRILRGLRRRNS